MNKVLGKKYVDSKGSVVALAIVLLLMTLFAGVVIFGLVHSNYNADLQMYELDLWMFENGYSSSRPTPPSEPLGSYVLIISLTILIGGLLFYLPFAISKSQHSKGDDVVCLDEDKEALRVLSDNDYYSIPLKSIVKIKTENMGIIPAGRIMIPYKHSYGKLIIKYSKNGNTYKVKTNVMKDVEQVATEIKSLID